MEADDGSREGNARAVDPHVLEEGETMALFFAAFVGGLVGTGLMDIAEIVMEGFKVTTRKG